MYNTNVPASRTGRDAGLRGAGGECHAQLSVATATRSGRGAVLHAEFTTPSPLLQLQPERLPVSKPGLVTRLPPGLGVGVGVGVLVGVGVGVGVGVLVPPGVGVGGGVPPLYWLKIAL